MSRLTPTKAKEMMGPQYARKRFTTLPIPMREQKGMGHGMGCGCGCKGQRGGDFLGIGKAFSKVGRAITSNPLRLATAIGTLGMSEAFLTPAQLLQDSTGIKASKVLSTLAPVIGAVGAAAGAPELGLASKFTSAGLKQAGFGKRKRKRKRRNRKKK